MSEGNSLISHSFLSQIYHFPSLNYPCRFFVSFLFSFLSLFPLSFVTHPLIINYIPLSVTQACRYLEAPREQLITFVSWRE